MERGPCVTTAPVPPPSYHRACRKQPAALHLTALLLVTRLPLLDLCRLAVHLARRRCPPPLPKGPGGRPRTYTEESLLLIRLLGTLWRLPPSDMAARLRAWPALALARGLPPGPNGCPRVPSPSQQWKRARAAGAAPDQALFLLAVRAALRVGLTRGRDLIVDSAPIRAWRRADPDAAAGHAPAHHRTRYLFGYRVHPLLCRGSGLPLLFLVAPANAHDAPFARPLLALACGLFAPRPRVVRLDAAYWGAALGAVAVIPWNPKRCRNRACLPPTWTAAELGKRTGIARFFGRVFGCFHLQRPPVRGRAAVTARVALTYTAVIVVALAAHQAGRPDLIRSPKRVLAHLWEGGEEL